MVLLFLLNAHVTTLRYSTLATEFVSLTLPKFICHVSKQQQHSNDQFTKKLGWQKMFVFYL